jgi:hypothetical protein
LGWDIDLPCHNSIENWVKKSGLSIYKEPGGKITKQDYGVIIDESMMVGSEKLVMTLGCKAKHPGKPLSHNDVEVLGMSIRSSWNGAAITSELNNISKRSGHAPAYVISDNAGIMNKGVCDSKLLHIRDISHSLGMFMKRIYDNDQEFKSYMKELAQVKFREVMNPVAYLLPPKQRSIARFMNLSPVVNRSKILKNYHNLTEKEQKTFSFCRRYASFIDELQNVLRCVNSIEREIKRNGLSHNSVKICRGYIKQYLLSANERMTKMAAQIIQYLNEEVEKLPSSKSCWNASSDVLESIFGVYKSRKSPNSLYGVTSYILFLPLHTRIGTKEKIIDFDFKHSLESVFMREIEQWKRENLSENQVSKRVEKLKAA